MGILLLKLTLSGLSFTAAAMTFTAWIGRRLGNYGVVDAVWALGFLPLVWLLVGLAPGRGGDWRQWSLPIMLSLWSLRLGVHLSRRIAAHHPREDVRYAELRREWGARAHGRMFWFFQLQGLFQVLLLLPLLLTLSSPAHAHGGWVVLGWGLFGVGFIGETIADLQLSRFRSCRPGAVCNVGLWRYSRHPNYFCEWLMWLAFACTGAAVPWGWVGLLAPALMYHLLRNVTGVPMTEELSIKSKGDDYREYQSTTNAFWPGLPRRTP